MSALSITPLSRMPASIACWTFASVYSPPVQLRSVPALTAYDCPPAAPPTSCRCAVGPDRVCAPPLVTQPGGAQSWPLGGAR